ncbi:hypothetical protein ABPG77_003366 [Micractinium sp. CCAP 211/92]
MEFKTCVLGPAADFLPPGMSGVGTFQTWNNAKLQATIIGSSTGDGRLRCVFILPGGVHSTLKTAADYEAYLADAIPSLPEEAVKRAAPQLAACPISNGGTIVRCTKLNSRRAVLVGDAAHSVYPSIGQGANSALEGASVLAAALKEVGVQDLETAAAEYSRRWLPNAHDQSLINSTRLPYATILQRSKQELLVFKCILAAAVVAVVAALWRSFGRVALAALGLA